MHVRLAAYGLIIRDEHLLLVHWRDRGRSGWTLPGGGVEPGEDPVEGAVREIWEETGYHASIDELLGIDSLIIKASDRLIGGRGPMQALRVVYRASILGGDLRHEERGTTDEARWFRIDELADLRTVSLVGVALRLFTERPANGRLG